MAFCPILKESIGTFDRYVQPPEGAVYSSHASAVHGLTLSGDKIKSAQNIEIVWSDFVQFIEGYLQEGAKKGILVAWGRQGCDCGAYIFLILRKRSTTTSHVS